MAQAQPGITALNAGELSPLLAMAFDFNKYRNGLKRLRNFLVTVQGPIYRRPAFRFIGAVKNSDQTTWLAVFEYSVDAVFILEFGHQYVRFYANHGRVVEATQSITAITKANPGVVTKNAHGYLDGQDLELSSITGMVELQGRTVRVANKTANTFELHDLRGNVIDTTAYGAFTAGDMARVYEVATPYTSADLTQSDGTFALDLVQSRDVVYIAHKGGLYQQRKLTRLGATNWTMAAWETTDGPFNPIDYSGTVTAYVTTGANLDVGDTNTVTASAAIFQAGHVGGLFLLEQNPSDAIAAWEVGKTIATNDIRRSQGHYYMALNNGTTGTITPSHTEGDKYDGSADSSAGSPNVQWRYLHSGYGWGRITAIGGGGTTATITVLSRLPEGVAGAPLASNRWAHGFFSEAEGWPQFVKFFRERLALLRGEDLWHSVSRDYESFLERDAGVVAADLAFRIDLRSEQSNDPAWLCASDDLMIGTSGVVFAVSEIASGEPFGPGNGAAIEGPSYGMRGVQPVKINSFVLGVQRSGKKLREVRFDSNTNGYVALNRTVLAEHIAKGRIVSQAYQAEPDTINWATCANGDLLSFTFDPEHDVQAWAAHPLGGVNAKARCVVCAPSPAENGVAAADYDEVWAINSRTINGQTWQYVEVQSAKFDTDSMAIADAKFVDSWLEAQSVTPFSQVGNLWHLEGQTVRVMKNGAAHPDCLVTGGKITLNGETTRATVGLAYLSLAETMPIEAGAMDGTSQGKKGRIHRLVVRVFETVRGFFAGGDDANMDRVGGVAQGQQVGSAPSLSTGDQEMDFPGEYGTARSVIVKREDVFPFTLVGAMPKLDVS